MRTLSLAILAIAVMALQGCAAMSEQACLATDWRTVGFEDGIAGRSPSSIGNYRQACADFGITPDLAEYRAGHADGVESYCRAGNGFEVGRRGSRYLGVCPAALEPGFLAAYNEGRELYEMEAALLAVDNQIAARMRRSEELAGSLVTATTEVIADETTSERRAELMLRVAAIGKEQGRIGEEITALKLERSRREADLVALRQRLVFASL
jgi:hypothetical protein